MLTLKPETDTNLDFGVSPTTLITKPLKDLALAVELIDKNSHKRAEIEQFIKQGFARAYNANVERFMPVLLAVHYRHYRAALGIRTASLESPFFIEQYTNQPIETMPPLKADEVCRHNIAEIGNLHSNGSRFTLQLFLTAAVALYINNYTHLVFAGTEQVIGILASAGLTVTEICPAQQSQLNCPKKFADEDWGSYYQTKPTVAVVTLSQIMTVINGSEKYQKLFSALSAEIANISGQMAVLL